MTSYHKHGDPVVKLGKMSGKVKTISMRPSDAKSAVKKGTIKKLKGLKSAVEEFEKKRKKKKKKAGE